MVTLRFCMTGIMVLGLMGCDWDHFALMNSIPVRGDPDKNPVVHVFLAVDGLAYSTVEEVMQEGLCCDVKAAKLVSMFPATSDASWSRIFHSAPMDGYEYEFYDPLEDKVVNNGYMGLVTHGIPPFEGAPLTKPAYYRAFDYSRNGYLHTLWSYQKTGMSYADTLDNLFFTLSARSEIESVYTAYLLEIDVMGHMQSRGEARASFARLWKRIRKFKSQHKERQFIFTIFSDHGMDFLAASNDQLIDFDDQLKNLGLNPVKRLQRPGASWKDVIPIIHTRVSYLSMHTQPGAAARVAALSSRSNTIDLATARLPPPTNAPQAPGGDELSWFGIWRGGERIVYFGYDSRRDVYVLPASTDMSALDMPVVFDQDGPWVVLSDEQLFASSIDRDYPDLFYRVRSAFAPVGVKYPGDVLLSFARPYASRGFEIPGGANEIASAGFHGGLDAGSSLGALVTDGEELPAAVRSENLLMMYPQLVDHMQRRGVAIHSGVANSELDYTLLP